ncbi:MAG: hypothetical protein AVDCRST_MAG26-2445, partial [uncultured Chloroflexia bacterium]
GRGRFVCSFSRLAIHLLGAPGRRERRGVSAI